MTVEQDLEGIFKESFRIFRNNYVTLILGTLISLLLMIFIITIPPMIFGIFIMCIALINKKKIRISDIFKGFDYFFRSWGIFILMILSIAVGLVFLIIPGILLMIMFQYVFVVSVTEKLGVVASLKKSYAIARANLSFSAVLFILLWVLNSIGSLTRIGVLLTFPFSVIVLGIAVRKLKA